MSMLTSFITIFSRDLNKVKNELSSYTKEKNIWLRADGISNPAGNLCLHLVGNLNTYIGAGLGNTGYIRNREQEFTLKNVSRDTLLQMLDDTIKIVTGSLHKLSPSSLEGDFPILIWEKPMPVGYTLIQLAAHLNYHLGQINYHRRLLDC